MKTVLLLFVPTLVVSTILGPSQLRCGANQVHAHQQVVESVIFTDSRQVEHEELAFSAPQAGLPEDLLQMFCASVKVRFYWNAFRSEFKVANPSRKVIYLRRMARLARHIFPDIRDADKPFNETMRSKPDEWFAAPLVVSSPPADDPKVDQALDKLDSAPAGVEEQKENKLHERKRLISNIKDRVASFKLSRPSEDLSSLEQGLNSENTDDELDNEPTSLLDNQDSKDKMRRFLKHWGPKVALGVYTRWRTMWWLMYSCLFAKYYLWDPILEEFVRLQRTLVMWPQLQVTKLHELQCKPVLFFRRLLDTCKILNPLMRIDFGQFALDKLTRFKSDTR